MDLGVFSQVTSEQPPCGIDLDDTGELFTLEQLAAWDDARAETDWPAVRDAALSALGRSRDLRVCPFLAGALLHTEGTVAFCDALRLQRMLLETFWDDVFPKLDDGDATERSNAVFNLTNYYKVIRPLRDRPVVEDRAVGSFSLFDLELAQGKIELPKDYEGDPPQLALIEAAFQAAPIEQLQILDTALAQAVEDVSAIESLFNENAGIEAVPDMARLSDTLKAINKATATGLARRGEAVASGDSGVRDHGDVDDIADAPSNNAVVTGAVAAAGVLGAGAPAQSRDDVARRIDEVMDYFRIYEPTSPVPLLLQRARRLIYMDFISIIEDLAPSAVDNVVAIRGKGEAPATGQSGEEINSG